MKNLPKLLFVISILALTSFIVRHHGWSSYDQTKVLDFTTVIEESTFANPHTMAKVKYEDEIWSVYLAPASRMTARGLSADAIKKGTSARLVAYPHKTEKGEMRAERIYIDGEKYELR
jgi:hypothetical protein